MQTEVIAKEESTDRDKRESSQQSATPPKIPMYSRKLRTDFTKVSRDQDGPEVSVGYVEPIEDERVASFSEDQNSNRLPPIVDQDQPLLEEEDSQRESNKWLNLDILEANDDTGKKNKTEKNSQSSFGDQHSSKVYSKPSKRENHSEKLFESSDISLSMSELSENQSMVRKAFSYYEGLDKVKQQSKLKRLTTYTQKGVINECEYEDFYEEIEHIIRQENIQKN